MAPETRRSVTAAIAQLQAALVRVESEVRDPGSRRHLENMKRGAINVQRSWELLDYSAMTTAQSHT